MILYIITALLAVLIITKLLFHNNKEQEILSKLRQEKYWLSQEAESDDVDDEVVHPFTINVPKEQIDELTKRLDNTRFPVKSLDMSCFHYGVNSKYMHELCTYWKNEYSWPKQQDWMNSFDHYKTKIEGLNIHFIHAKPKNSSPGIQPKVLLMTHGWPGSIVEFLDIIPMLTDPVRHGGNEVDAFTVVCPSIPGYGFSDAPQIIGFNAYDCGRVFQKLMMRLGYTKYYVHGGDWGSLVSTAIATMYPQNVKGIHTTMLFMPPRGLTLLKYFIGAYLPSFVFSPEEQKVLLPFKKLIKALLLETGYMHLQSTKPDTVGFALSDSPLGLAAYIVEKFSTWTDLEGRKSVSGLLEKYWTKDQLLNNVMVYWWNNCITSSMRFYKENISNPYSQELAKFQVKVPAAFCYLPNEFFGTSVSIVKGKFPNLIHFTFMKQGGHFATFEVPHDLACDIRSFASKVEKRKRAEMKSAIEQTSVGVSQLDRVSQ